MLKPFPQTQWYLYPRMKEKKLRFEMPYQERIKRHGAQLANRLHEIDIDWWENSSTNTAAAVLRTVPRHLVRPRP